MAKRRRTELEQEEEEYMPGTHTSKSSKRSKDNSNQDFAPNHRETKTSLESDQEDVCVSSLQHPNSVHIISSPSAVRRALLKWYATVNTSRGMPWRKPYDPTLNVYERAQRAYEVWVSEVMLQQTQVSTVIPYYNAWMKTFPTINHLAESSIDQVNALWKGLGYYSRASRLLAGAQKVVEIYEGRLPDNAKEMEANIPGIGRYSAGAICSIAYGERVPVLDGNVHRLFSRFLALHALPKSKATLDVLWAAATAMVEDDSLPANTTNSREICEPSDHPGDVNQALIELGSTVCKIRDPNCGGCPLNSWCVAYNDTQRSLPDIEDVCTLCVPLPEGQTGVMAYPMKVGKKKARAELDIVSVVEWRLKDDRQFLLVRRPNQGLLAGLYEFPTTPNVPPSTSNAKALELPYKQLLDVLEDSVAPYKGKGSRRKGRDYSDTAYRITAITSVGDVLHVFTHIKKTYRVQWVVIEGGHNPPQLKQDHATQASNDKSSEEDKSVVNAFWACLDEVTTANIGTGVSKIWNLALSMWDKETV